MFLRRVAQASLLASGVLATCASWINANDARAGAATLARGHLSTSTWRSLARALRGQLVLPTTPGFSTRALLYNSKFTSLRPQAIAYCTGSDDVARCIDFVNTHDVAFAARSGGHSYGGYSSSPGLIIDVSRLNAIEVDVTSRRAKIGAGARLIDVYNVLGQHGLVLPSGSCPTVGIAGITLGGGVGVFARKFGLTCDHLYSSRLVTASATQLSANAETHSDLWWALRGGGGGNFGVVTSFDFDLAPMPRVTLFSQQFPWRAAASVLEGWQHWISTRPDELWSDCQLLSQGSAGYLLEINGVLCGTATQLAPHLRSLRAHVGAPTSTFVGGDAYLEAMKIEAGCSQLSVAACHLAGVARGGVLGHEAYSAKSTYVAAPDSSARCAQWVNAIETQHAEAPYVGAALAFDAYGGAVNRVAQDATAFVHRDQLAGVQATFSWGSGSASSEIAAGERWLEWLGAEVFDVRTGVYQNYIDPTLAQWRRAYYGTNLARLEKIKMRYDPDNRFSFAQSIAPRSN